MSLSFKASELPNPFLLTAPENLEYMRLKEAEAKKIPADKKSKAKRKRVEVENDSESLVKKQPAKKARTIGKSTSKTTRGKASSSSKSPAQDNAEDLFSVSLDGDNDETVEIYDSCDEIRRKINEHLRVSGSTKAALLRDIARAGWPKAPPKIQSKQLTDFLTKSGATSGSTSRVFYGAYVYFEKKRSFENKPKSGHRLEMEARWETQGGLPRERPQSYLVCQGYDVVEDRLGTVRTQRVW